MCVPRASQLLNLCQAASQSIAACDAASAMIGVALVYPGWNYLNWGSYPRTAASAWSLIPGLGAVYVPWVTVPVLTVVIVTFVFLMSRTFLMRGEDPFHKVLWVSAAIWFVRQ